MGLDGDAAQNADFHDQRNRVRGRRYYDKNILNLVPSEVACHGGTVAVLEKLLDMARAGEVIGLAYIAICRRGTAKGAVGILEKMRYSVKGYLLALANEL